MVKVRFAPSPTGYLHLGGARTALFNWMYARAQGGKFILRIEDTDKQRSSKEYENEILDSMKWLGLDWDEIYYQSKRFNIYKEYAERLVEEEKAYRENGAIFLKTRRQEAKVYDLIRGEIVFDTSNFVKMNDDASPMLNPDGSNILKDEVLIKADGSPAYSFCCVVDDALMEISCVIRGEDHLSNTPKQILIYQALGFKPPKFAHLPLIMGEDGGRMSKRTGAVAVSDYKKKGFLPVALVNYLMLLGWSPGANQEIINLNSAVKKFSIKKINKAKAVFSLDKLKWVSSQHIKQMDTDSLVEELMPLLKEKKYIDDNFDKQKIKQIVFLFKRRMSTLTDFLERADFIFFEKVQIEKEAGRKYLSFARQKEFALLSERLNVLEQFNVASTEKVFRGVVEELGVQPSDLVHPVRVALTGRDVGPGLFETMEVLGKEKTVKRLLEAFA